MPLWVAIVLVVVLLIYTAAKVFNYMRQSKKDWQQVDKSKLKEWDDEDDWPED